jgi:hypothetical protein
MSKNGRTAVVTLIKFRVAYQQGNKSQFLFCSFSAQVSAQRPAVLVERNVIFHSALDKQNQFLIAFSRVPMSADPLQLLLRRFIFWGYRTSYPVEIQQAFHRNISPLLSRSNNRPREKLARNRWITRRHVPKCTLPTICPYVTYAVKETYLFV